MSSECGQARRHLWPDAGPRTASREVIEARSHVDACLECRRFIGEMREMSALVRGAAPCDRAPAEVRRRLFTTLARERTGTGPAQPRMRSVEWRLAAFAALVVFGAGILARPGDDAASDRLGRMAEDHARASGDVRLASDDPVALSRWLEPQVYFAVHVPVLPEARLRGARIAALDGRRVAVIEYELSGVGLSYFIVRDDEPGSNGGEVIHFDRGMLSGYAAVTWRDPGRLHVMISGLPEARLETLAKICVDQARGVAAVDHGRTLAGATES
ncbi:MAG: hypothetical protein ABR543_05775 [Gemmatimonadaceae bacterium]